LREKLPRRKPRRQLSLELLESRTLLTAQPVSDEVLVNATLIPGAQSTFAQAQTVATRPNGDTVVVFSGRGPGDKQGVFAQRLEGQGSALGGPVLVNQTTRSGQQQPSVAVADTGSFVVVWSGNGTGDNAGVFARRFDADGSPAGDETLVNLTTE